MILRVPVLASRIASSIIKRVSVLSLRIMMRMPGLTQYYIYYQDDDDEGASALSYVQVTAKSNTINNSSAYKLYWKDVLFAFDLAANAMPGPHATCVFAADPRY
eukprot:2881879-Rhodomonas_salina.2